MAARIFPVTIPSRHRCYNPSPPPNGFLVRRLLCIFLLMLVPLHGFAMQGGLSAGQLSDIAHDIEHLQAASHHHHDEDGSVHYDDSGESALHFADHAASHQSASPPPSGTLPVVLIEPFTIRLHADVYYIPDPFLEDPQRPPASLG